MTVYFSSLLIMRRMVNWRGKPLDAELRGYVLGALPAVASLQPRRLFRDARAACAPRAAARRNAACEQQSRARSVRIGVPGAERATRPRPRAVHNAGLALLSSFLLAGILYELALHGAALSQTGVLHTAWVMFCDPSPHVMRNGRLLFLYYLNYITKYLELSDTVLLCLRGKPLPFLHVYHHAATLVLCWTQLAAKSSVQWVPIVLNLMVHVPMYYYYAVRAAPEPRKAAPDPPRPPQVATLGLRPWWKKHLTSAQIIQFCLDVPATAIATTLKARPRACRLACDVADHVAADERGVQVGLVRRHEHGLRLRLALCRVLRHRPAAELLGACGAGSAACTGDSLTPCTPRAVPVHRLLHPDLQARRGEAAPGQARRRAQEDKVSEGGAGGVTARVVTSEALCAHVASLKAAFPRAKS